MGHTETPQHTRPPAGARRRACAEAAALLHLAQAGHTDAFAQLYTRYVSHVHRYIAARLHHRDREAVPDLVQDTFCTALANLHRAHDDVEGWLIQLAATMCTRYAWAQRRYLRAALTVGEHQQRQQTAESTPGRPDPASRAVVAQALAALEPSERRTLQLRFLDGQQHATAAAIMGCSPWTVKQRQRRALRHLAARLSEPPTPASADASR